MVLLLLLGLVGLLVLFLLLLVFLVIFSLLTAFIVVAADAKDSSVAPFFQWLDQWSRLYLPVAVRVGCMMVSAVYAKFSFAFVVYELVLAFQKSSRW